MIIMLIDAVRIVCVTYVMLQITSASVLCNGRLSVRPSFRLSQTVLCPSDRHQQLRATGLLLSALLAADAGTALSSECG